jgi:outer membrane receptor protein involved in Fe transport
MKSRLMSLLAVLTAATVPAQTQTASPGAGTPAEVPVALSAFTVTGTRDVGYTATNTLAGTRLNTPLLDIGTAISVINRELLDDLAATHSGALLPYTVGTEVGGTEGNFAGGVISGGRADQTAARISPERNQRVRGLAAAELTRDYFLTDIPFDSYNTESVTINRGPNALLFGIGSPGGVINHATILPQLGQRSHEVRLQIGQRGSHRETVDLNLPLVPRRLAVRLASLNELTEYRQRPAYERDQRWFGAVTAVLAENRQSPVLGPTTVRANAEYGEIVANPPNPIPPGDAFSTWWELPPTSIRNFTGGTLPAYWANGTFVPRYTINNRTTQAAAAPTPIVQNYFLQLALIYSQPGRPNPGLADPAFANLSGGQGRILWTGVPGRIRVDAWATQHALNGLVGFDNPVIQDRRIFDYYNLLFTGETNRTTRNFRTGTFTVEQSLWRGRAGIELTYDHQRHRNASRMPFSGLSGDVSIDISQFLGNDQPNPNLGRPSFFIDTQNENERRTENDTARATAFATLDGRDLFRGGRGAFWFGRHVFTGLWSDSVYKTFARTYGTAWVGETVDLANLLTNSIDQFRRQVTSVVYVGPSLLGAAGPADVRLQPIDVKLAQPGDRHSLFYFDPATRSVRTSDMVATRYLASANLGRREIKSSAASVQSYWLGSHVITLAGLRRDEQRVFERVNYDNDADPSTSDRLPSGEFNPQAVRLQSSPADVSRGDTLTWSVVGRLPSRLRARWLKDTDLRLFVNRSENFNPVGARRSVYNELLDPPGASTKEYGFMAELFGGRVSARLNRFETAGEGFTNAALQGAVNSAINQVETLSLQRMLDAQTQGLSLAEVGLAQVGVTSYDQAFREIINFLPEPTRTVRNLRIVDVNGIRRIQSNPIVGAATTTSFVAKGWELDLTANPVRGLRVMANVARQETVKSDIGPEFRRFVAEMLANIDKSPLRGVRDSPILGTTPTYRSRFVANVVTPLNAELTNEGTASLEQRKWRANLVASYDFRERLKGWGVGAGARWQSGVATGYVNVVDADGIVKPDLARPFVSGPELNGDFWISYRFTLWNGRLRWKTQLNLRNLVGSRDPITVRTNPDGVPAIVRAPPERLGFLTNTIQF